MIYLVGKRLKKMISKTIYSYILLKKTNKGFDLEKSYLKIYKIVFMKIPQFLRILSKYNFVAYMIKKHSICAIYQISLKLQRNQC